MEVRPAVRRGGPVLIPAMLVLVAGGLTLSRLADAPRYVARDEIVYSLNAQSLASTGRDLNGRFLPMFIEYPKGFGRPTWDQPLLIYAIAGTLKAAPFSEFSMRLPMAIAAVIDVLLLYGIGRLLFGSTSIAAGAALLLALTPAHFIHARMATDFQLWVPFALGWLLSVLLYLRGGRTPLLFIAGVLLGAGLYGYVAAYLLVPISVLLTFIVLYRRGDRARPYVVLLAGIAAPTVLCIPWMLRSPLPFRDILAHYAVVSGGAPGGREIASSMWQRLADVPIVYLSFWDPRFLFIDGPLRFRSTQLTPVFLTPLAGLMALGIVHAVRRREPADVLLLGALATAPIPASVAGESQAVWRALQLAPFGVLLAATGFQQVCRRAAPRSRRVGMLVALGAVIALAVAYHDVLPQAQALVRAATAPLAIAGFAIILADDAVRRVTVRQIAATSAVALAAMHAAYLVIDVAVIGAVVTVVILCVVVLFPRAAAWLSAHPLVGVAFGALAVGHFLLVYVDYAAVHRMAGIPARLVIAATRLAVASAIVAAAFAIVRVVRDEAVDRWARAAVLIAVSSGVVLLQIAYFAIDTLTSDRARILHAGAILVGTVVVARLVRIGATSRVGIGTIAAAGIIGLIAIRFAAFHHDYFTGFQVRGSVDQEGNVRVPFEMTIDRATAGSVPSIYLGRIGPYAGGDLYWRFYLLKHRREDLAARTIVAMDFLPDRVRTLPAGSIVITSPTKRDDVVIDEMQRRGDLRRRELIAAPDGSPIFWILEKS